MKIGKGRLADAIAEALSGVVLPPGASVTLGIEMSEDGQRARVVREHGGLDPRSGFVPDPIGGPPLYVSNRVLPDAMALYMLSTAISDCTRALESHEAEIQKARETHLGFEAAYKRAAFWSRAVFISCTCLAVVGAVNFAIAIWGALHGH